MRVEDSNSYEEELLHWQELYPWGFAVQVSEWKKCNCSHRCSILVRSRPFMEKASVYAM